MSEILTTSKYLFYKLMGFSKAQKKVQKFGIVREIYFDIVHEYKFNSEFMKTLFAVAAINLQLKIVAKWIKQTS